MVPFLCERQISKVSFSSKNTVFDTLNASRALRAFLWIQAFFFLLFVFLSRMCTLLYSGPPGGTPFLEVSVSDEIG